MRKEKRSRKRRQSTSFILYVKRKENEKDEERRQGDRREKGKRREKISSNS